ncbi:MAG: hypothetical protein IPJ19_18195 [Planctomycetes bacterium]|nr:hypothetical protein [Planctomycetota bacterium]
MRLQSAPRGAQDARNSLVAFLLLALCVACAGGGSTVAGAGATQLSYSGPTDWKILGLPGGPFSNPSADFTLLNTGELPIAWSASAVPGFVHLDLQGGLVPANGSANIHAELDETVANSMPIGELGELLGFRNDTSHQPDIQIDCTLSIADPVDQTQLAPLDDFASAGTAGGPFLPESAVYQLSDGGTLPIGWQASVGDPWVLVTPSSGSLAPSDSVAVTIGIDAAATNAFLAGMHSTYVEFVDPVSNTTLHSREVSLNVSPGGSNSEGWTQFKPSADTRKVFVSSSTGDDANDGLSEARAKRTIAAGKALMRDGFPDWLLLRCGDTWDEAIGDWPFSGRSLDEPTLISSYGTGARPFLRTGLQVGIVPAFHTNPDFVSIVGLHFKAHTYNGSNDGPSGVNWIRHTTGFLLEDCYIERYASNVIVQGFNEKNGNLPPNRHTHVRIRRNVISEAYKCINSGNSSSISANGLFVSNCDDILIEENFFDHNGTLDSIPGAIPIWFRHNGYVTNGNTEVVLRGNIVYGSDGVMMRAGGIVENNLYLQNYNAILYGLGIEPEPDGVTGSVRRNVVLDSRNYGDGEGNPIGGGLALDTGNLAHVSITDNIFAHNTTGTGPRPIQLRDAHEYNSFRVAQDLEFTGNIVYDWGGVALEIRTGDGGHNHQLTGFRLSRNCFENARDISPLVLHTSSASQAGMTSDRNKFFSSGPETKWFLSAGAGQSLAQWKEHVQDTTSLAQRTPFPDPGRDIAKYQASLGGTPTLAAFVTEARAQSKAHWRPQYTAAVVNAYIRAGFGK